MNWLVYTSSNASGQRVFIEPHSVIAVERMPDGGSRIYLDGGATVGVTAADHDIAKRLMPQPSPPELALVTTDKTVIHPTGSL